MSDAVERGCGFRKAGGAYLVTKLSEWGRPLEDFLIDPPLLVDAQAMGLSPVGVTLFQAGETWHVMDWVGSDSYPNVADFVEEVKRFGLSRRIAKTTDFAKLTEKSRIILVHPRAFIENSTEYQVQRERLEGIPSRARWCPKHIEQHRHPLYGGMCAGLWHEDVEGGEDAPIVAGSSMRYVERHMPSFWYAGYKRPDDVTPQYKLAAFLSLPLHGIEIVRDATSDAHEQVVENASASALPVDLVDR